MRFSPYFLLILACSILFTMPLAAQNTQSIRPVLYEVELKNGNYQVNLSQITSISMHRFYVDSVFAVDEITVDTFGNTVTRFYFVDRNREVQAPRGIGQSVINRAQEKVDQVKDRAGTPDLLDNAVIKSYPTSTHAHTVEYRIESKEQLDQLYSHMTDAWKKGQAGKFKFE